MEVSGQLHASAALPPGKEPAVSIGYCLFSITSLWGFLMVTEYEQIYRLITIKLYNTFRYTRVYPKVSELAAWSENCKWYSSLPLCAVVSLLCESV
jgi:hypothetical protein